MSTGRFSRRRPLCLGYMLDPFSGYRRMGMTSDIMKMKGVMEATALAKVVLLA